MKILAVGDIHDKCIIAKSFIKFEKLFKQNYLNCEKINEKREDNDIVRK